MTAFFRLGLLLVAGTVACSNRPDVPSPADAVARYADALQRSDAAAVHAMLDAESQRSFSREQVSRILSEQTEELRTLGASLAATSRPLSVRAQLRYADGEVVSLSQSDGAFRVDAAMSLPALARTPVEALHHFRVVLARRSYAGLLRILTPRTRAALESDLTSLVEGLRQPEALEIDSTGERATVRVPGGHRILLKREEGAWHVDDFD